MPSIYARSCEDWQDIFNNARLVLLAALFHAQIVVHYSVVL